MTKDEMKEAMDIAAHDEYRRPPKRAVVITVPGFISQDEGAQLYENVLDVIPDAGVIILDGGKQLQIIQN